MKRLAMSSTAALSAVLLMACYGPAPDGWKDSGLDSDGDGFTADVDCNDEDAAIHPDATEVCDDKIDNDCDTLVDAADDACTTT
jgi:hypothetical protein